MQQICKKERSSKKEIKVLSKFKKVKNEKWQGFEGIELVFIVSF
jgi:hypothetical protein